MGGMFSRRRRLLPREALLRLRSFGMASYTASTRFWKADLEMGHGEAWWRLLDFKALPILEPEGLGNWDSNWHQSL